MLQLWMPLFKWSHLDEMLQCWVCVCYNVSSFFLPKVTSHCQVHCRLLPNASVGTCDEHRFALQSGWGLTHSTSCIFSVSHTQTTRTSMTTTSWLTVAVNMLTLLQNQSRPPPCSSSLSSIGTHGLPGLIIHRENRSESYERRARAPGSQSPAPINARMFNPSPRRARWLVRAADRWLPLHLFAKLPLLHQYALLVCVLIEISKKIK